MVLDVTSRFSKANVIALQDFLGLGEITPYTFVIFTKAKQLASKETDQQTAITKMLNDSNIPESLSSFMQKVNNRYLLLESVDYMGNDYLITKLHELTLMLDKITAKTGRMFTCHLINHAKNLYEKENQANRDEISRHNAAVNLLLSTMKDAKHKRSDVTMMRARSQVLARVLSLCLVFALLGASIGYTYTSSILATCPGAGLGCIIGKVIYDCIEKHKIKLPSRARVIPFCLLFLSAGIIIGSMN